MRIEGAENDLSGKRALVIEKGGGGGGGERRSVLDELAPTNDLSELRFLYCLSVYTPLPSPCFASTIVPVRRIYRGEERTGRSEMEIGGAARTRARRVAMVVVGEGNWSGERVAKRWW